MPGHCMTTSKNDLDAKFDEYHLMIEDVLGGMDMMVTRLEIRISALEDILGISSESNHIDSLHEKIHRLRVEVTEGLNLAFRKIGEK